MNVGEANRVRACLDCGEPGALLWRTTKGENAGRLLRICAACLRKDDWHRFGLVERQPILGEVPTEFYDGEWHFPKAEGPEPWAVTPVRESGGAEMIGSLFSGLGGLELGLEWAGLGPVAWQCEADAACRSVLRARWPGTTIYNDVREVRGAEVQPVDIICGGFPCQDVSLAGKGAGLDGARSGLWFEYGRIVREVRPRFVVVENVAALVVRGLDRVLGDLAESGYDALWFPLRASDVGAPHRRERVFIVAWDASRVHVGPGRVPNTDGGGIRELTERSRLGARATDERDAVAVDVGADGMGNADGEGRGSSWGPGGHAHEGRVELAGRRGDLADAEGERRGQGRTERAGWVGLAAPIEHGREHAWPPGPKDVDGWARYLSKHPGSEPAICRETNGISRSYRMGGVDRRASRRERLRMLGNAVVPQCAEVVGWVVRGLAEGGV